MKTKPKTEDPLKTLLKQHGTLSPAEGFSLRLMNAVVTGYKLSYSRQYRKKERLGKWIIGVLMGTALLIFVALQPTVLILEMLFPVFALGLGLIALILMLKRLQSGKTGL